MSEQQMAAKIKNLEARVASLEKEIGRLARRPQMVDVGAARLRPVLGHVPTIPMRTWSLSEWMGNCAVGDWRTMGPLEVEP